MVVNYRDLTVYEKARELVMGIDRLIKSFPPTPQARVISSQMFAAATSTGANIAEGKAKASGREYLRYLVHAQGSANETDHWLYTVLDCGLSSPEQVAPLTALVLEILKILSTARSTLNHQLGPAKPHIREAPAGYEADQQVTDMQTDGRPNSCDETGEVALYEPLAIAIFDFVDPLEVDNP